MELIDNKPTKCKFCESKQFVKAGKGFRSGYYIQRYECKECRRIFVK